MQFTGLIYLYSLACLSIAVSILIAGFALAPAFKYFEKKDDMETARRKSLGIAIVIWMSLQAVFCLLIFLFNKQLLL